MEKIDAAVEDTIMSNVKQRERSEDLTAA